MLLSKMRTEADVKEGLKGFVFGIHKVAQISLLLHFYFGLWMLEKFEAKKKAQGGLASMSGFLQEFCDACEEVCEGFSLRWKKNQGKPMVRLFNFVQLCRDYPRLLTCDVEFRTIQNAENLAYLKLRLAEDADFWKEKVPINKVIWSHDEANTEDDLSATNLSADLSTTVDEIVAVSPGDVKPGAEEEQEGTEEFPERPHDVEVCYDYESDEEACDL